MDLVSHFNGLLSRIEPTSAHVAKAKAAHEHLRDILRTDEDVGEAHLDTYLAGSYARHTAILDIKDVDIICLLNLDKRENQPIEVLRWLEGRLLKYPYKRVELQGRSIGVTTDDGIDLDVVPGTPIGSEDGPLWIPDRQAGAWVDTHSKGQIAFERQRNKDTNGYYVHLVKMSKYWRNRLTSPATETKSYVVEALVAETLGALPPDSHAQATVTVLEGISKRYSGWTGTGTVPQIADPGYPSKNVAKRWKQSEFVSFMNQVRTAAAVARRALDEADETASEALWKKVFGDKFAPAK